MAGRLPDEPLHALDRPPAEAQQGGGGADEEGGDGGAGREGGERHQRILRRLNSHGLMKGEQNETG